MNRLNDLIPAIRPADEACRMEAVKAWNRLAKPLGSLGVLEEDVAAVAALTGDVSVPSGKRTLLVFCADNGVIANGVSQSDESVTEAVAAALGAGTSTVNYMAAHAGCDVVPVDIGMKLPTPENVLARKIRCGTDDISKGPAMTREECEKAVLAGIQLVKEEQDAGTNLLLVGEMGIGNTTTTAAVSSVLLNVPPEIMTGRGAGLSDDGLARKTRAVKEAVSVNKPDPDDPLDVLQKVGGLDLAALCGVCLGGALYRVPVILDGVITNTAALLAVRMCPPARDALIASHLSSEPAAKLLLEALRLSPVITAGLHLGEGSGALLALSLLDQTLAVYHSGHTFSHLGIDAYTPQ